MLYQVSGVRSDNGHRVRVEVEADSPERALDRVARHGVLVAPGTVPMLIEAKPALKEAAPALAAPPDAGTRPAIPTAGAASSTPPQAAGNPPLTSAPAPRKGPRIGWGLVALIAGGAAIVSALLVTVIILLVIVLGRQPEAKGTSGPERSHASGAAEPAARRSEAPQRSAAQLAADESAARARAQAQLLSERRAAFVGRWRMEQLVPGRGQSNASDGTLLGQMLLLALMEPEIDLTLSSDGSYSVRTTAWILGTQQSDTTYGAWTLAPDGLSARIGSDTLAIRGGRLFIEDGTGGKIVFRRS